MYKKEIKYLLPLEMLPKIRMFLAPYLRFDKFSGPEEAPDYTVRSIYFDTKKLKFYHEKLDGLQKRLKVRIRSYNTKSSDSVAFLELKRKEGAYIYKNRFPLFVDQVAETLRGVNYKNNFSFMSRDRDRKMFLYHLYSQSLNPVILVIYEREAYHYKFNPKLRITFDKNIRCLQPQNSSSLFEEKNTVHTFCNRFVLELKYHKQFPGWLMAMIKYFHLQSQSVSKYTLSIDKLLSLEKSANRFLTKPSISNYWHH